MLYYFGIFLILIQLLRSDCVQKVLIQNEIPVIVTREQVKPVLYDDSLVETKDPIICPNYKGKMVCCTNYSIKALYDNFTLIDMSFGATGDGCINCGINLKKFWCKLICDSDQDKLITHQEYKYFKRDEDSGPVTRKYLYAEVNFNNNALCDIFKSCKDTTIAKLLSNTKNSLGFFNFLGSQGKYLVDDTGSVSNMVEFKFIFSDKNDNFNFNNNINKCSATKDLDGYIFKDKCSCNNCSELCEDNQYDKYFKEINKSDNNKLNYRYLYLLFFFLIFLVSFILSKNYFKRANNKENIDGIDIKYIEENFINSKNYYNTVNE